MDLSLFETEVHQHIGTRLLGSGYRLVSSTSASVLFGSAALDINIFYEPGSFEIGATFCVHNGTAETFGLASLIAIEGGPGCDEQIFFQGSNDEAIRWCVAKIARLFDMYGKRVLLGDTEVLDLIMDYERAEAQHLTDDVVAHPIRAEADEAWKGRDMKRVVALYESIECLLSTVERKRLDFAQTRVKTIGRKKK